MHSNYVFIIVALYAGVYVRGLLAALSTTDGVMWRDKTPN